MNNESKSPSKEALKEDFSKLQKDAKEILGRIKEAGGNVSHSLGENAMKVLEETAREGSEKIHEYMDTLEETIKKRPIFSTAVSFGVGVLIARMMSWTPPR